MITANEWIRSNPKIPTIQQTGIVEFVRNVHPDYVFVSDSQDVQAIKADYPNGQEFDSFFVMVGDGEYTDVLGMHGIVPRLDKRVYRVLPGARA